MWVREALDCQERGLVDAFAESLEGRDTCRHANREDIRLQRGARLCWELAFLLNVGAEFALDLPCAENVRMT